MVRNFCILILLINFAFSLEEFIFWADVNVKNGAVASENIQISKSMFLKNNSKFKYICTINKTKNENTTTLNFLNSNKDSLFNCFSSQNINVRDELKKDGLNIYKNTKIVINPIHFIIEFKTNSAIIYKLQGVK